MVVNQEALRARLFANSTTVTVGGTEWKIGKFSAREALALFPSAKGKEDAADDEPSVIISYVDLLSKCLLNGEGRAYDSDEGRALLIDSLPWGDIVELSKHALDWNGFGDGAKKN